MSNVELFAIVTAIICILSGILLTISLYFSDGPVLTRDKSLVSSDENSDD